MREREAQTCWERVKTAAGEAEKPRNIQQKLLHRKSGGGASKHAAEVGCIPQMRRASTAGQQSRCTSRKETLTGGLTVFSRKSAPQ